MGHPNPWIQTEWKPSACSKIKKPYPDSLSFSRFLPPPPNFYPPDFFDPLKFLQMDRGEGNREFW
ncbi:hypothetical protein ACE6H2_015184 [Prunus campanulata]